MEQHIRLRHHIITYTVRRHPRAKRLRVTVSCGGRVAATLPRSASQRALERFLRARSGWLLSSIAALRECGHEAPGALLPPLTAMRRRVQERAEAIVARWNRLYGFPLRGIVIKNQKTIWGSCTLDGVLNFNYQLHALPEPLFEYVAVHELCHLQEMHHGPAFWRLVSRALPDYRERRAALQQQGIHRSA